MTVDLPVATRGAAGWRLGATPGVVAVPEGASAAGRPSGLAGDQGPALARGSTSPSSPSSPRTAGRFRQLVGLAAGALAVALVVLVAAIALAARRAPTTAPSAVAGRPSTGQAPAVGDGALAAAPDRIALQLGGLLIPLENGMRVPAGDDLAAELFFAPYPPTGRSNLDVYVVGERTGAALADAQVALRYQMPDMEHGVILQPATPRGNGHYLLPLNVTMAGNWQLAIQVSRPGQRGEIALVTTNLPAGR